MALADAKLLRKEQLAQDLAIMLGRQGSENEDGLLTLKIVYTVYGYVFTDSATLDVVIPQ